MCFPLTPCLVLCDTVVKSLLLYGTVTVLSHSGVESLTLGGVVTRLTLFSLPDNNEPLEGSYMISYLMFSTASLKELNFFNLSQFQFLDELNATDSLTIYFI